MPAVNPKNPTPPQKVEKDSTEMEVFILPVHGNSPFTVDIKLIKLVSVLEVYCELK